MATPSSDPGLEVLIRAVLDAKGFEDLKTRLKELATQHQDAKPAVSDFGEAINGLGRRMIETVGAYVAVSSALSFVKDSIRAAVEESRELDRFDAANRRLGDSTAELTAKNHDWLHAVEDAAGISKRELIPAYTKLSEITTTTAATQGLLQIAAGAAARGLGDVATISTILGRSLLSPQGAARATGEFGLLLKRLHEQGKTTEQVIQILTTRFGDAGKNVHNAGTEIDRMRVANERAKAALGETGATLLQELAPAMRDALIAVAMVEGGFVKLWGVLKGTAIGLAGLGKAFAAAAHGDFVGAWKIIKKASKEGDDALVASNKKASEIIEHVHDGFQRHDDALKAANSKTVADIISGLAKIPPKAAEVMKAYEAMALAAKNAAATSRDGALAEAEVWKKAAADRRLDAKEREKAAGEVRKLTLEVIRSDFEAFKARDKTRTDEEKREQEKNKFIREDYQKSLALRLKLLAEHYRKAGVVDEAARRAYQALLQETVADNEASDEQILQSKEKLSEIEIDLAKKVEQAQKASLDAALGFMDEAFGQSKATAIANAVIHTYEGAAKALDDYPYPYSAVVAALVIATGLAQVAKIETADPKSATGGGFDDPINDYAAYMGGRKWAQDFVDRTGAGFSDGLTAAGFGGQSSSVVQNYQTSHRYGDRVSQVHIHGAGIFDAGNDVTMRLMAKKLLPYLGNLNDQRKLR